MNKRTKIVVFSVAVLAAILLSIILSSFEIMSAKEYEAACTYAYNSGFSAGESEAEKQRREDISKEIKEAREEGYEEGYKDGIKEAEEKEELSSYSASDKKTVYATNENTANTKGSSTSNSNETTERTVYVTKTGSKYHRYGCRYLKKSCIPISASQAKGSGYTACSVCDP